MQINKELLDTKTQEKLGLFLHSDEPSSGKIILLLGLHAGLSAEEIAQLKWSDVDFLNGILHVCGRAVPLSEDLSKILSCVKQAGAYVIYSRKAKGGLTTRMNIAWTARNELNAAGLPDITLRDLRALYILRAVEKFPMKEVARISGFEIVTLRNFIKSNSPKAPLPKPKAKQAPSWDATQFETALENEGDTLDTRIVWLCWQGGLTLRDMPDLYWENISFQQQTWQICGTSRRIPPEMCDRLQDWEPPERRIGPVLKGTRSGKQLDPIFVIKRAQEFLIRNGFESATFSNLRGGFYAPSVHDLSNVILDAVAREKLMSITQLVRETGEPRKDVEQCLHALIQGGKLRYSEMEQRYLLPGVNTNRESVNAIIAEHRQLGTTLTVNEIAVRLGIAKNLIRYYLQCAEAQGDIKKIRPQTYLCI